MNKLLILSIALLLPTCVFAQQSVLLGNGTISVRLSSTGSGVQLDLQHRNAFNEQGEPASAGTLFLSRALPNPSLVLDRKSGEATLRSGDEQWAIWVDPAQPIVWIEANAKQPFLLTAQATGTAFTIQTSESKLLWYHRNASSNFAATLRDQGLASLVTRFPDPLSGLTYGGAAITPTIPSRVQTLQLQLYATQQISPNEWHPNPIAKTAGHARASNREWWRRFWDRSYVRITGSPEAIALTQAWEEQRYEAFVEAVAPLTAPLSKYWRQLATGDYEPFVPLFIRYQQVMPLVHARTQLRFQNKGSYFPSKMTPYGAAAEGASDDDLNALELVALMVAYYSQQPNPAFLRSTLLPIADEILTFYDERYLLDETSKLRIDKAGIINPTNEVAGLHYVLGNLLWQLKNELSSEDRVRIERLYEELPPVTVEEVDGKVILQRAGSPLQAIFPFRLYGVGKANLDLATATLAALQPQDPLYSAYLGIKPAGLPPLNALLATLLQFDYGQLHVFPAWPAQFDAEFRLHAELQTVVTAKITNGHVSIKTNPSRRNRGVLGGAKERE